ncbi:MAG: hypothetical protein QM645_12155, partial [Asticcacaulis sp.]
MFKTAICALAISSVLSGMAMAETAQDTDDSFAALCKDTPCRNGGYEVLVNSPDGKIQVIEVLQSPYVALNGNSGAVLLFPGETIAVQFDIQNDQPVNPRLLQRFSAQFPVRAMIGKRVTEHPEDKDLPVLPSENRQSALPPNTLLLSFGQMDGLPGMVMIAESTLPKRLKYKAIMTVQKDDNYYNRPTSSCPVLAGASSYEHWPHTINNLLLHGFVFQEDDDKVVCN